jgi:hypothetical protein
MDPPTHAAPSAALNPPPNATIDSELGRTLIEAARGLDPLAARGLLKRRYPDATDELIRAATVQSELASRAEPRFGPIARGLLWTSDGLEQASRPSTSRHRAARLAAAGIRSVTDLTCGLGLDALTFAQAGLTVLAVEQDPATASLAAANAKSHGAGRTKVVVGSCTDPTLLHQAGESEAWFVDPARRPMRRDRDGRHLRLDDPEDWSPPWSWVLAQAGRVKSPEPPRPPSAAAPPGSPRVLMVKAAPGLPHNAITSIPGSRVDAEWVSEDGQLLETCVTWWRDDSADASPTGRAAVILDAAGVELVRITARPATPATPATPAAPPPGNDDSTAERAATRPPITGEYLLDPDPAIVRSGVVGEFAAAAGARLIDSHLAYLASGTPLPAELQPAARSWRVLDAGSYDRHRLRVMCAEHGIGHIEVTGRGRRLDPTRVRRDLALPGGGRRGMLVVMGLGSARSTYVCLCEVT